MKHFVEFFRKLFKPSFDSDAHRLRVYEVALELLEATPACVVVGLCYIINDAEIQVCTEKGMTPASFRLKNYPEIMDHKPKEMHTTSFWFNAFDKAPRKLILEHVIREMKS